MRRYLYSLPLLSFTVFAVASFIWMKNFPDGDGVGSAHCYFENGEFFCEVPDVKQNPSDLQIYTFYVSIAGLIISFIGTGINTVISVRKEIRDSSAKRESTKINRDLSINLAPEHR